jgi:hypothetical protein
LNRYDEVPGEDGSKARDDVTPEMDSDATWMERFKRVMKVSEDHYNTKLHTAWSRSYRAVQNRHFSGSKYDTYRYKNRSKLFKPKTMAAVRKNDATAAASLFSTEDVVSITAERTSDKLQATTARFLHEDLNYRLDRSNKWAGPNWFLTSMGARHETQVTGICVTKQYWEYEERIVEKIVDVPTESPAIDATGMPILDLMTGAPLMETVIEKGVIDEVEIVRDRLMITNIPSEHARIDYTGDWRDPIQEGGFFIADYPVRLDDVEDMIKQSADRNKMGGKAWRSDIDIAALKRARSERSGSTAAGVRRSRDDGQDRYEGAFQGKDNETIWLHEVFYRKDGEDWHYWVLGNDTLLSDPRPTRESYPEQKGDRPYVRGLGALEPHKTHPMAPVESWQPIQMEINDTANLALDAMKMAISPITKIKRGTMVDRKQLQNRGPDALLEVNNMDDVDFTRAPDPSANSQNYIDRMSVDMDELAGVFSGSSVQSNRSLNETVGGMQLLNSSANALTEFDLRVWVETWVEPCLAQCINCIKQYESDEVVIAVAGERAGLIENIIAGDDQTASLDPKKQEAESEKQKNPFQPPISVSDVLGNLDNAQVMVKVNVGIGALDNNQRMQKFMMGFKGSLELMPALKEQGITLNAAAVAQEIWGLAGYKDADRFYLKDEQEEGGPPPEIQKILIQEKGKKEANELNAKVKMQTDKLKADNEARSISLEEREFEHQKAMDMMQQRMDQMQAQFANGMQSQQSTLDTILKALSLGQKQQPQGQPQRQFPG